MDLQVVAIKALQLLCCLSLLVVLHEFGHYGFSKLFRVKVEKFYMFFNPKFHLFSTRDKWFTRLFPYFKNNETEYGIGWLPLGGYVKISGMVDESMDTEQMKQPAQPWEFRSQKVWKRFFIMAGGVIMNLITAWVIYSAVLFTWGHEYIPMRNIKDGFQFNEYAQSLGFRNGDIPVAADGDSIIELSVSNLRTISNASVVTVLRGGEEVQLNMPEEGLNMLEMLEMEPAFMAPVAPIVVDTVMPGSPAEKVGMRSGSRICSIDGIGLETWGDFDEKIYLRRRDVLESPECTNADSLRLRTMAVVFVNPGMEPDSCVMELGSDYMMGVVRGVPGIKPAYKEYTLLSSIPAGLKFGWNVLSGYVNDLKYIPSKKGAQSVGSFVTIGSIFPAEWDWLKFWNMTALISIILAVMNILPIPGLDGGHIVLLGYEAITGHAPSDKAMEWIERIGLFLILALMLLGFGNDFVRFVFPLFGL